jgi:hypothetical protein
MGDKGRSERSGKARNKLVCFEKRLRADGCVLLLFFTMNIEQLMAAVYSRRALLQQKHVNHHNRGVNEKLWEGVAVSFGSNSKYIKLYSMNLL